VNADLHWVSDLCVCVAGSECWESSSVSQLLLFATYFPDGCCNIMRIVGLMLSFCWQVHWWLVYTCINHLRILRINSYILFGITSEVTFTLLYVSSHFCGNEKYWVFLIWFQAISNLNMVCHLRYTELFWERWQHGTQVRRKEVENIKSPATKLPYLSLAWTELTQAAVILLNLRKVKSMIHVSQNGMNSCFS